MLQRVLRSNLCCIQRYRTRPCFSKSRACGIKDEPSSCEGCNSAVWVFTGSPFNLANRAWSLRTRSRTLSVNTSKPRPRQTVWLWRPATAVSSPQRLSGPPSFSEHTCPTRRCVSVSRWCAGASFFTSAAPRPSRSAYTSYSFTKLTSHIGYKLACPVRETLESVLAWWFGPQHRAI